MIKLHTLLALNMLLGTIDSTTLEPQYNLPGILVSKDKPVLMSSVKVKYGFQWEGKLAVDGDLCQCPFDVCAGTDREDADPMITLDLEKSYRISQINIFGMNIKTLALKNLTLYLSNTVNIADGVLVHTVDKFSSENITLTITNAYRYVIATRKSERSIIICEIQVFTPECSDGFYGDCTKPCGKCLYSDTCDKISGECPRGCSKGYKKGLCEEACDDGYFSYSCDRTCGHCKNAEPCDKSNGHCLNGCEVGYSGTTCKKACSNGYYGNCTSRCGRCKNLQRCHKADGRCVNGCEDGYTGPLCKMEQSKQSNSTQEHVMQNISIPTPVFLTSIVASLVLFVGVILSLLRYIFKLKRDIVARRQDLEAYEDIMLHNSNQSGDNETYETLQRD